MASEGNIKELMLQWRAGVKHKCRGIATFRERMEMRLAVVEERMVDRRMAIPDWKIREAVYLAPGKYDYLDKRWRPIGVGDRWGAAGRSAFFRRRLRLPADFRGRKVVLRLFFGGDALLRVNGEAFHSLDPFHYEALLTNRAKAGRTFHLEVEAYVTWHAEKRYPHTFALAEVAALDEDVHRVYWDFRAAIKMLDVADLDPRLERFLSDRLWEALKHIPLQEKDPALLRRRILEAGQQVRRSIYASDRFRGQGLMHLVGHSHLDLVFQWPYKEYLRKIARTHSTMLRLMEQYPEFKFCQSQAQLYADMKKYWPDLYAQVKKRVAEGRWEIIGAFWVEPDCNLISGESFVRQILYGQKFFQKEFGFRSRSCWIPDVFGMSWAMPQILARSGIPYALTNKMVVWNDTNPWTQHTFWWEGVDGSRVLGIIPPGHFIGTVDPDLLDLQWRAFSDKETVGETLHIYGWGDGGSGPDAEMIECGRRYRDFPGLVKTRFSAAEEAFDSIRAKAEKTRLPVYRDELYLEAHRGTFTTKARLKKLNRRMELLYREAELVSVLAHLDGRPYPADDLQRGWEMLLTTQFHNALPGSHITEVYHDLLKDFAGIRAIGEKAHESGLRALVGPRILRPARGGKPAPLIVFNSLLHARSDCLAVAAADVGRRVVADPEGGPLPQQRIADLDGTKKVLVSPPEVPPVGYRMLALSDGRAPARTPGALRATARSLENEFLKVRFDRAGRIVSIRDKEFGREVLVPGQAANRFQMYEDTPGHYEAWDIAPSYIEHEIPLGPGKLAVDETGPIRASLRLEQPIGDSLLVQRISLAAGSRRIVFETRVRWVERQRLLKVAFPVDLSTAHATYDIAFGNMKRPAHRNDSYAAARFEVPAHQWMDLSQADYGVSLMNDCKYGHEANARLMRLTLLKGPTQPDPESDKETHDFTYVLYPHAGSWREARTNEAAMELNCPLLARPVAKAPAETIHSFLRCDAPGLALEAVKAAEDGKGVVVRLVERLGGRTTGQVAFDRPIRRAWTCNLMEENEGRLPVADGSVAVTARPYEILTLRLVF